MAPQRRAVHEFGLKRHAIMATHPTAMAATDLSHAGTSAFSRNAASAGPT
jgi:hypothetical protein